MMFESPYGQGSGVFASVLQNTSESRNKNPLNESVQQNKRQTNSIVEHQESKPTIHKEELTDEEKREVAQLKRTDREVRAHEQAHKSVAGAHSRGAIQFRYETGPDGKRYAVGGEVNIDVSKVQGDPEATVRKMRQVRQAALAPSDPSPQDRRAAMHATRIEAQAQAEARKEAAEEKSETQKKEEIEQKRDPVFDVNADHSGIISPTEAITKFKENLRLDLVSNLFELYT